MMVSIVRIAFSIGFASVRVEVGARGEFFEDEGIEGELFVVGQDIWIQC